MEPVVQPPAEAELHLLTDWSDPDARSRHRKAAAGAIAINLGLIALLAVLPEGFFRPPEPIETVEHVTPLVLPPIPELTQRDPNNGKITKEFEVRAPEAPHKAIQMPSQMPQPADIPRESETASMKPAAPPTLPEPPRVEAARTAAPQAAIPSAAQASAPPPQIQTAERPTLTFESVPPPAEPLPPSQRRVAMPNLNLNDIAREVAHGSPIGMIIGDAGASDSVYGGASQAPTPGNPLANIQLKSDTMGVDFRPYLIQILATIKRNWMAVIPESARMGRRGRVALQISITKEGTISKVVYAENSGTFALDQAAVAGVSASNPLPPLPREFRGDRIVLQLNFAYR